MASELPLWYGRERGVDLVEFADEGEGDLDEGDGGDPMSASAFGTLVVALLLAAGVAVMAASPVPLVLTVLAGIAGAAVVGWSLLAISEAGTAEDPGAAALTTVAVTAAIGEAAKLTLIIAAFVVGIAFVIMLIGALSSGRD